MHGERDPSLSPPPCTTFSTHIIHRKPVSSLVLSRLSVELSSCLLRSYFGKRRTRTPQRNGFKRSLQIRRCNRRVLLAVSQHAYTLFYRTARILGISIEWGIICIPRSN